VLATRAGDHDRLLAAFRKTAEAHLTGPVLASEPGPANPGPAGPAS